jgi:DNA primase
MGDEISQIKTRLDIVDLISSYITLKRSGRNFTACCPFHQEKTPSFFVSPDRQSFHCFGCQKGGDIFSFLMEHENINFREALERLASQAGVTLDQDPNFQQNREKEKRWTRLLNCAGHFFRQNYLSDQGKVAREYMEKRGFSQETIDTYKIGYAPDGWSSFIDHAKSKGYTEDELVLLGLARRNDKGHHYDFFRHRVMFPVRNAQGQVIAFGGRVLDQSEPKYMNSPETPLFNKRRTLFNFTIAKEMSKEHGHFLMMEGYTDVMMATQFNLGPAVATLGTAMTEEHVRLIKRFDLPLYLVYDGDRAGRQAMERALPFILKLGLEAKAISLPKGFDPADFLLNTEDWQNTWKNMVSESSDVFDFKLKKLIEEKGIEEVEHKVDIAKIMLNDLQLNKDIIRQGVYLDSMSEKLGVDRQDLEEQLKIKQKEKIKSTTLQRQHKTHFKKDAPFFLLALCLIEKFDFVTALEELSQLPFFSSPTAGVLEKWLKAHAQPGSLSHDMFMEKLTEREKDIFKEARVTEIPTDMDQAKLLYEEKLQQWTGSKPSLDSLNQKIKNAEKSGDMEELMKLMKEKSELIKKS